MKTIQVVRSREGKILGMSEMSANGLVSVTVEPADGQTVEEIEVTNDYQFSGTKKLQLVRGAKGELLASIEAAVSNEVLATPELGDGQRLEDAEEDGSYLLDLGSMYKRRAG